MPSPDLADYRPQIEAALAYAGWSHTFDDVAEAVAKGEAQAWYGPRSVIVTEIDVQPRRKTLHIWLAGGDMAEIQAMTPGIRRWAEDLGCTVARIEGRKGWARSYLARDGWQDTGLIILERPLNG